jgi:hypothetical protein
MNEDGAQEDFTPDQINYADVTYIASLMAKVIQDVDANGLYKPEQNG